MNQLYSNYLRSFKKGMILTILFLSTVFFTEAQVYTAQLSGPNEAPPNASPGTGSTTVTITGTQMRIQATFSGLTGNTTVAHIHAPTAVAGAGTAPAIVTTPTLPGFPAGVQSGSYDIVLNMENPSSYSPTFFTNNGGTAASAFAALKVAMNDGKAYFNIHTNVFPAGEIRGFLAICPTINVTIPDAYAIPQGAVANTVYPGYAPASSITLTTNVTGGTAPYTYTWSNGSASSTISVNPVTQTTYSVTIEDQNGCTGMATKTINIGAYDQVNGAKVTICHKGKNSLHIDAHAVAAHLAHGDVLGSCSNAKNLSASSTNFDENTSKQLLVSALPNPSKNYFNLQITGSAGIHLQMKVYDVLGRNIESLSLSNPNQIVQLGNNYKPGIYLVEIVQGEEKQILRLVKGN